MLNIVFNGTQFFTIFNLKKKFIRIYMTSCNIVNKKNKKREDLNLSLVGLPSLYQTNLIKTLKLLFSRQPFNKWQAMRK